MNGQRIVLLGGTAGLGLATAQLIAGQGAQVVVVSRSEDRVGQALATLPASAEGHTADLSDEASIAGLFAELCSFDHLVYTAGENLVLHALQDTDLRAARSFLETRLWGAITAVKHAAPHLRAGGSIVLMSGSAGARPQAGWAVAALICGAVEALTRALAVELAPIRVNAVAPGVVRTGLWDGLAEREAMYEQLARTLPVGRVGEPEDVARGIAYLLGDGYTTGTTIAIDGGTALV